MLLATDLDFLRLLLLLLRFSLSDGLLALFLADRGCLSTLGGEVS